MEPIYKLLVRNRNTALRVFKRLRKIKGISCDIYIPISNDSIFGLEDSLIDYDGVPEKVDEKLLIFNLFQEDFIGRDEFDPFIADTFVLTPYNERLPLDTKIVIKFMGREITMKVDDHKNLVPHIKEQLFVKNVLVAMT